MNRARPGSNASRRAAAGRGDTGRPLRKVPASARRGVNTQKTEKARQARTRARRTGLVRRTWAAARILLMGCLIAGGLGAAGVAGWRSFQNHGFLALRQVEVTGNNRVSKAAILEKAGLELGVKLPSIAVGKVEASLRSLPGVGQVSVRRMFPSRIEIRVEEKEPVAMGHARGWYGLAPDGSRMSGLDWANSDLPVVDGFASLDSSSRAALGSFLDGARSAYPELYANFSQLSLRGRDGLEIFLRDGSLKVLVNLDPKVPGAGAPPPGDGKKTNRTANNPLNSLEFLRALIAQQGASLEAGKTVDLRVEGYAYVR